ncbi:MAG TPA: hypothetical protein V6D28_26565 [Leptolyngbyaceae cyanobacterium]
MKSLKLISIVTLLALGGSIWLPTSANAQTTPNRPVPRATQPGIAQLSLTLDRQPNENYDTLVGRAEAAARNIALRTFNQNPGVRGVNITVLGQNEGSIAPLLSLEVNRQNWASRPNTQLWSTYFKTSRSLLRLDGSAGNVANQPVNGNPGQANVNNGNAAVNNNGVATNGNPVLNNNAGNAVFDTVPNNAAGTGNALNQNGQGLTGNPLNNTDAGFVNNPAFNNNNLNNPSTGFSNNPGFNNNNQNNTGTGFGNNSGFNNNNPNSTGTGFGNNSGFNNNNPNNTGTTVIQNQ